MNQPAQKKGLSPLAWIAIGCLGIMVLGVIVVSVGGFFVAKKAGEFIEEMEDNPGKGLAETVIKLNPETDFISSDEETVTFEKDGEVMTLNFEDIQNGNFSVETEEGTSSVSFGADGITGTTTDDSGETADFNIFGGGADTSDVPDVVRYPGADNFGATFTAENDTESTGMVNYNSSDSLDEIVEWHKEALGGACKVNRVNLGGARNANLDCGDQTVNLVFTGEEGNLKVMAQYNIKH